MLEMNDEEEEKKIALRWLLRVFVWLSDCVRLHVLRRTDRQSLLLICCFRALLGPVRCSSEKVSCKLHARLDYFGEL